MTEQPQQIEHCDKHLKTFKPNRQALGMICCVPGIGIKRAEKALDGRSVRDLLVMKEAEGLTEKQLQKIKKVISWKC